MSTVNTYFDDPAINREYIHWREKIGADANATDNVDNVLSVDEALRAHFLVAEFFADEENGLGGIGPRDNDGHLLHSAVARQTAGYNGVDKWTDEFDVAATVFFGLVKNHPFHDGNKRTALLSVLHLLAKQGYTASAGKKRFENLVVAIANGGHRRTDLYRHLRAETSSASDADVAYISSLLKQMMRKLDRSRHPLTYRRINQLLKSHGFEMKGAHDNRIGIVRIADDQAIGRVGFPGMSKQVSKSDTKKIRAMCNLTEAAGYDSRAFYNGMDSMNFLLSEYAAPLRRLAHR
ncbi:MAG: type II toxin-antitoxin system death-on-curing family toxin [Gammaproteobacteria bacterium]